MPLATLTDDRGNAPQVGIDWTNDPNILQIPKAIISCEASTTFHGTKDKSDKKFVSWHKLSIKA